MGLGPTLATLYVTEVSKRWLINYISVISQALLFFHLFANSNLIHAQVSPFYVRGTYGSFTQIAASLGLMSSLFIGFPAKETEGW